MTTTAPRIPSPGARLTPVRRLLAVVLALGVALGFATTASANEKPASLRGQIPVVGAAPVLGDAVTAARFGKTGLKVMNAASDANRIGGDVVDLGGDIARVSAKAPSPSAVTPPKAPDVPKVTTPDTPDVTPAKAPTPSPDAPVSNARLNEPVPGAKVEVAGNTPVQTPKYPRGEEPYKNQPSPNGETVIGPYMPNDPDIDYVTVAGNRGSGHFDMGDQWNDVDGPIANQKHIEGVIERGDTVHSTVSVSDLHRIRAEAAADLAKKGDTLSPLPGNTLLDEWAQLEAAGYTWTGPYTLSPPGG